jgi:hypothetical protein
VHVKAVFVPEIVVNSSRSVGKPWSPDDKEKAWMMDLLEEHAEHTDAKAVSHELRELLIAPDHLKWSEALLTTLLNSVEICEARKGTVLVDEGLQCEDFLVLLKGTCEVGKAQIEAPADQVPLSNLFHMMLGFNVYNQNRVTAKTKVEYLRIDGAAALRARTAETSACSFPPAAYHVLSCVNATERTVSVWRWSLHRVEELLPPGSFSLLTSDWFVIPQVIDARWRLHLVPSSSRVNPLDLQARTPATLLLGIEQGQDLSSAQQHQAKFTTSLEFEDGTEQHVQTASAHSFHVPKAEVELLKLALNPFRALAPESDSEIKPSGVERLFKVAEVNEQDLARACALRLKMNVPTRRRAEAHARLRVVTKAGFATNEKTQSSNLLPSSRSRRHLKHRTHSTSDAAPTTDTFEVEEQNNPLADGTDEAV